MIKWLRDDRKKYTEDTLGTHVRSEYSVARAAFETQFVDRVLSELEEAGYPTNWIARALMRLRVEPWRR